MAIGRNNSWRNICPLMMVSFISISTLSYQSDTILPGHSINFTQTIISRGSVFELGFFSPVNSSLVYLGIRYKRISRATVVWVANGDVPIPSYVKDDANLILSKEGDLQLQIDGEIIWRTYTTTADLNTTKAVIHDSGNLIVGSDSSPNMWESFNYPTDTWLPGAKIGLDATMTGKTIPINLRSGFYSFGIDPVGPSELFILKYKTNTTLRIGASDVSYLKSEGNITFNVSETNGVKYATYHTIDNSAPIRIVLDTNGHLRRYTWNEKSTSWLNVWTSKVFDSYTPCGSNGICSTNQSPFVCSCPEGFHPKYPSRWELHDYSGGCVVRSGSQCLKDKDEFIALHNIKSPPNYTVLRGGGEEACQFTCAANCKCSAYYSNTLGCYQWFGDLLDMERLYNTNAGVTIFLRLGSKGAKDRGQDLLLFDLEMNSKRYVGHVQSISNNKRGNRDLALPIFTLSSVFSATNNFSSSNKLGEGGFGPVYKGTLRNSQEVAVKRLSKHSGQGLQELINEAKLIAELQHNNLVRLLGCCIQKDEKILIYEYMPNKSLDFFFFDIIKKKMLDWSKRMCIIEGIAQGLLYLHHYARLRIIHRDLKASNILLDADMKPKISDFGMARIFGGNQLQANTKHIVGTIGYMPPEYALEGLFSIKTDVFSFGVLLLEILSGERNTKFCHEDCLSLIVYAWKLWTRDTPLELLDPILKASCDLSKALRYIHVGLLCVQEHPDDRPSILDIVAMIGNEMKVIEVQPKQPAYLARTRALEILPERFSLNELTYSTMQPR